jgi:hypothetical protein
VCDACERIDELDGMERSEGGGVGRGGDTAKKSAVSERKGGGGGVVARLAKNTSVLDLDSTGSCGGGTTATWKSSGVSTEDSLSVREESEL